MIDHSWKTVIVDGEEYRTNGINLVRCHGVAVPINSPKFKRVIEAWKQQAGKDV